MIGRHQYWDETDWILAFVALLGLFCVMLFVALGVDLVQDYRAYPAKVACAQRQMQHRRRDFSATVTCVPNPGRRDTTTVQVRP